MNITIHNIEEHEPEHLATCIARVRSFYSDEEEYVTVTPEIHCRSREASGWLEYSMVLPYIEGGRLCVGAIQRTPGAEVEFHS